MTTEAPVSAKEIIAMIDLVQEQLADIRQWAELLIKEEVPDDRPDDQPPS